VTDSPFDADDEVGGTCDGIVKIVISTAGSKA
jgi:hypothetical protein